jgi:hypothetical protein
MTYTVTAGQIRFLSDLLGNRNLEGYNTDKIAIVKKVVAGELPTFSGVSASCAINELKALPKLAGDPNASAPIAPKVDVPEGRYAVDGEDGTLKFYQVDRPTEGKWAGYVFVKVQASDELHPIRGRAARDAILAKIAEVGPEAASKRYGHEIGACGVCGRTLTDENSRANGIGPICSQKMGW